MRMFMKTMVASAALVSASSALAVCDQFEYERQYNSLRNIWLGAYQNNCIHADHFLANHGQTIHGLSSCRVDSRNQATRDFAQWVKGACINGCEKAGEELGESFGRSVVAEVCHTRITTTATVRGRVQCLQRVAQFCLNGLQDVVAQNCPQAINSWQYQNAENDCHNWAN